MANYFYTAKATDGKTVTGTSNAKDTHELSKNLKEEGLILIEAVSDEQKKKKSFNFSFSIGGVPASEKILMTRNLSVMVATGRSLVNSFEILSAQSRNKKLKNALILVKEQINKGQTLSSALGSFPDIFSEYFMSMIKVGEESGTLEEVLKVLALQLEKEHKLKSEMQGAMIYPGIVLSMMLAVGIVIAVVVLPRLNDFFKSINTPIPIYTKILIGAGQFSTAHWPILIIVPIVLIILLSIAAKTKTGKWLIDTALLRTPIVSTLIKKSNCAIFIRSLSSLLGSGVALTKSLEVISGTVGNFYFKKAISEAQEKIKKGEKLYEALLPYKNIFPYGALEMIEVGEETGKTSSVLKTLADFYEDELISATSKLSSVIEPVLLIVLGLAVAFFAFSIIEPMYSSLQAIK